MKSGERVSLDTAIVNGKVLTFVQFNRTVSGNEGIKKNTRGSLPLKKTLKETLFLFVCLMAPTKSPRFT